MNYHEISISRTRCSFLLFVVLSLVFVFVMGSGQQVVNSPRPESPSNPDSKLVDFTLIGSAHAWATEQSGTALYHTETGGALQTTVINFEGKPLISFVNAKTGFALAYSIGALLWRTTDGGQSWQKVRDFDSDDENFPLAPLHRLHFVDAQHGWLVGVFGVWRTEDGGAHWAHVFNLDAHPEAKEIYDGAFSGSERAVIATPNGVYLSVDGGRTWKSTNHNQGVSQIYLLDDHTGWLWSDVVERTDDGGNSWRELFRLKAYTEIRSAQFINKEEGWATGIEMADSFRSVVRNPDSPAWHGVLLHTTNGGKNWDHASVPAQLEFNRVRFSDSKNGWLLGVNRLYRTRDGAATWTTVLDSASH